MYRIEVKAGEETVFRTIEELATGIRNGFITPRARIYHAASQKWLPIEFHPHYKRALEGNFTPPAAAPQPSPGTALTPTFSFAAASQAPRSVAEPAAAARAPFAPEAAIAAPAEPAGSADQSREPGFQATVATTAAESPVLAMRAAVHHGVRGEPTPDVGPVERYSPAAERHRPLVVRSTPVVDRHSEAVERHSPAAVLDAPPRAPTPAPALAAEVVLPNITYPELARVEQSEHRAPARRSRRASGRPLLLVGSAAVLVFAGQRFLASRGGVATEPATMTEAEPPAEAARSAPAATQAEQSQPLVPVPARPMTPGPAFTASVPARVAPDSPVPGAAAAPASSSAPAAASHAVPRTDSTTIAPAPSAIEIDMPALLPGDSMAPSLDDGRDSLAIKRILKAVSGRKANPTAP
jgi:hypothetical protein